MDTQALEAAVHELQAEVAEARGDFREYRAENAGWREVVETKLKQCSTGVQWLVGLVGLALVGIVVALLTRAHI